MATDLYAPPVTFGQPAPMTADSVFGPMPTSVTDNSIVDSAITQASGGYDYTPYYDISGLSSSGATDYVTTPRMSEAELNTPSILDSVGKLTQEVKSPDVKTDSPSLLDQAEEGLKKYSNLSKFLVPMATRAVENVFKSAAQRRALADQRAYQEKRDAQALEAAQKIKDEERAYKQKQMKYAPIQTGLLASVQKGG